MNEARPGAVQGVSHLALPGVRMQARERKRGNEMSHLEIMLQQLTADIGALKGLNDEIQHYVSTGRLPVMKVLSDLDHLVNNMTRAEVD